jgi:hypothetical protein
VDSQNRSNQSQGSSGGGHHRRRRYRGGQRHRDGNSQRREGPSENQVNPTEQAPRVHSSEQRNRSYQNAARPGGNRNRSRSGRVLTTNQVLVKYDNLLEQHLITRKKYYEYFNRVDDRQLKKLEKNFFDSIEHLRRFEANLEPWQREALEKRKTERYTPDLTYSNNRGWNPEDIAKEGFSPDENEDPHFTDSQREAFEAYKEDTEESVGTFEDYLKLKGEA